MDNTSTSFDESKWLSFKKNLKKNVGDSAFNNWLKHLQYVSLDKNTITFSVPTKFLRDWIVNNYSDKIKTEAKNLIDKVDVTTRQPVLFFITSIKTLSRFKPSHDAEVPFHPKTIGFT